jgi:hypothetical protein
MKLTLSLILIQISLTLSIKNWELRAYKDYPFYTNIQDIEKPTIKKYYIKQENGNEGKLFQKSFILKDDEVKNISITVDRSTSGKCDIKVTKIENKLFSSSTVIDQYRIKKADEDVIMKIIATWKNSRVFTYTLIDEIKTVVNGKVEIDKYCKNSFIVNQNGQASLRMVDRFSSTNCTNKESFIEGNIRIRNFKPTYGESGSSYIYDEIEIIRRVLFPVEKLMKIK